MQKVETANGFVSLHRKITEWEWYDDANTFRVFIHCLLKANYKPKDWHGKIISRGCFITSQSKLMQELKLSKKQIRGALDKLKKTNELAYEGTSQYSIITIKNYNLYQQEGIQEDSQKGAQEDTQGAHEGHTKGNQRATTNKVNKENKEKNKLNVEKIVLQFFDGEFLGNKNLESVALKWFEYKKAIKDNYKSELSIKALIKKLIAMSGGDFAKADAIVEHTMANNWRGLVEPKDDKTIKNIKAELKANKELTLLQEAKKIFNRDDAIEFAYKNISTKFIKAFKSSGYFCFKGFDWIVFLFEKFNFGEKEMYAKMYKEIESEG